MHEMILNSNKMKIKTIKNIYFCKQIETHFNLTIFKVKAVWFVAFSIVQKPNQQIKNLFACRLAVKRNPE